MLSLLPQEEDEARQRMQVTDSGGNAASPAPQPEFSNYDDNTVLFVVSPLKMHFHITCASTLQTICAGITKDSASKHGVTALGNMMLVIIAWHATFQVFFKLCYC